MIDLERIYRFLDTSNLDAVMTLEPRTAALMKNLWYEDHITALAFEDHPTIPVFTCASDAFVVDFMSLEPPHELRPPWFTEFYAGRGRGFFGLQENLTVLASALKDRQLNNGRIGLDLDFVPVNTFRMLQQLLPHAEFVDASSLWKQLRGKKTPRQIEFIKSAIKGVEVGYQTMLDTASEGVSLEHLGWLFAKVVADCRCKFGWCAPIDVATEWFEKQTGGDSSLFWSQNRVLQKNVGEETVIYCGCQYQGFWADLAGAFYLGDPPNELTDRYARFSRWFEIAVEKIEPGMTTRQAYAALHEPLQKEFGFAFGTIHGIGLHPHEDPCVDFGRTIDQHTDPVRFEVNTVVCFQPLMGNTLYSSTEARPLGCIEDMYQMTDDGFVRLSSFPQELVII